MNKPTQQELEQLDRLARKHHEQLHFLRHSPRDQRNLAFEEDSPLATPPGDAILGAAIFFLFIAVLALAPWWMVI